MKTVSRCLVFGATMLLAGTVSANLIIDSTNVGSIDTLLGQTNSLNENPDSDCATGSNPTNELCWINNVLMGLGEESTTYTESNKVEDQAYSLVDGSTTVIGFELGSPTEYFLLKNSTWWGLFQNNPESIWAVIDTSELNNGFNLPETDPDDPFEISHIAAVGDTVTVPEPGALALLSLGLAALGFRRRLRKS